MDNDTPLRICSKCKQSFPLTAEYWHKDGCNKTGFCYACKECAKQRARDWGRDNAEYASQKHKEYYAENKERVHKPYSERNAERIAANKRDWRKRNPDKVKKHKSESQKRNRPAANERIKRHYEKYPERRKAQTMIRIARKKNAPGKYTGQDINRMHEQQEGMCFYCGIRIYPHIPKDMHVDHVIPLTKGGTNYPDNLVLACQHCNQSKNNHLLADWVKIRGW